MKRDIVFEKYMKQFYGKVEKKDFMKKYKLHKNYGDGETEIFYIEDGIELYKNKFLSNKNMEVKNIYTFKNVIEIGTCIKGSVKIEAYKNGVLKETYQMKEGESFFYSFANKYDVFSMTYNNCIFYTIMLDIDTIVNLGLNNKTKFSKYLYEKINKVIKKNYLLSWKFKDSKIKSSINYIKNSNPKNILEFLEFKTEIIKYMLKLIEDLEEFYLEDKKIKKCNKLILKNISKNITTNEISTKLKISDYILQKKIRENYGITFYQYIKKIKMEYAENLLKYTDMQIIEVASSIGYENPSKFSSAFLKAYGSTPLKYRKSFNL